MVTVLLPTTYIGHTIRFQQACVDLPQPQRAERAPPTIAATEFLVSENA